MLKVNRLLQYAAQETGRCAAVHAGRFAAIDIGTVTCRLLIADAFRKKLPDGASSLQISNVVKDYAVTNLGEGVDSTHLLKSEAIERVCEALKTFIRVMDAHSDKDYPIRTVSVMSTSAARDAKNSSDFVSRLSDLGLSLDVIPGSKEAALSFAGATIAHVGAPVMVVDVGGGSTEIAIGIGGSAPECSRSFDVGCRRVTERFLHSDPPAENEIEAARLWMRSQFAAWFATPVVSASMQSSPVMVAVAGTATSAVSIREHMAVYDAEQVDGSVVTAEQLHDITVNLARVPLDERRRVVGLDPRRAPVIVAGMVILEELMHASGMDSFVVSESDILDGMILAAAEDMPN